MDEIARQIGETARYCLDAWDRTARLAILLLTVANGPQLLLTVANRR